MADSNSPSPPGIKAVVSSSGALSLALLGDALIYAVLPVHAAAFGLTLFWVGVLLSINRFVRVLLYGAIVRITRRVGVRRACIISVFTAALSTAMYGWFTGPWWPPTA